LTSALNDTGEYVPWDGICGEGIGPKMTENISNLEMGIPFVKQKNKF